MYHDIQEKLGRIEERINRLDFMKASAAANEIGYYVFDYDPAQELMVRAKVRELVRRYGTGQMSFVIKEFDLFEVLLFLLKEKGYLERTYQFEETKGFAFMQEAVTRMLRVGRDHLLVQHIKENTPANCVVFLTGVGKSYPFIRSHNIINSLQEVMDSTPVVLFYPGQYKDFSLSLFGAIKDGNHYRALPLIQ
jgi:hypothetical protein